MLNGVICPFSRTDHQLAGNKAKVKEFTGTLSFLLGVAELHAHVRTTTTMMASVTAPFLPVCTAAAEEEAPGQGVSGPAVAPRPSGPVSV